MELINAAVGSAEAVVAAGRARAQSIELVAKALCDVNGQVCKLEISWSVCHPNIILVPFINSLTGFF